MSVVQSPHAVMTWSPLALPAQSLHDWFQSSGYSISPSSLVSGLSLHIPHSSSCLPSGHNSCNPPLVSSQIPLSSIANTCKSSSKIQTSQSSNLIWSLYNLSSPSQGSTPVHKLSLSATIVPFNTYPSPFTSSTLIFNIPLSWCAGLEESKVPDWSGAIPLILEFLEESIYWIFHSPIAIIEYVYYLHQ